MEKIRVYCIIGLAIFLIPNVSAVKINRVWMEEDKIRDDTATVTDRYGNVKIVEYLTYNLWVEVLNDNGEVIGHGEADVSKQVKNDRGEWKRSGNLAQYCYKDPQGNEDCDRIYYKTSIGFIKEIAKTEGYLYEIRVTAKKNTVSFTKDESFTIGNYIPGKPDLVITEIEVVPHLVEEIGGYEVPAIKFLLKIDNNGRKKAFLKNNEGFFSQIEIWMNNEPYGSQSMIDAGGPINLETLGAGDGRVYEIKYWEQGKFNLLKHGKNVFRFHVDYSNNGIGIVKEDDENNNEYELNYNFKACYDTEDGDSAYKRGTVELYGMKKKDSCRQGNIEEYFCIDDYHVGFGIRKCGQECVDGACVYGPKCRDTDGNNPHTQGIIEGYSGEERDTYYTHDETCINPGSVKEFQCIGKDMATKEVNCHYGCKDGRCKHFLETVDDIKPPKDYKSTIECSEKKCSPGIEGCLKNKQIITKKCEINIKADKGCAKYDVIQTSYADGPCIVDIECINGCRIADDECVPISTIIEDQEDSYYCSKDNKMMKQIPQGMPCDNAIQCETRYCKNEICEHICKGCFDDNYQCKPQGTRQYGRYCSETRQFKDLKENGDTCNNDYECMKKLCFRNTCTKPRMIYTFIRRIGSLIGY